MKKLVLILDKAGSPRDWVDLEEAVAYEVRAKVMFRLGEVIKSYTGGKNQYGITSIVDVHSILGVSGPIYGEDFKERASVNPERKVLYGRDRYMCCYCGQGFAPHQLTIEHIVPKSRGGKNTYMNTITACRRCNHRKADRSLEEANMVLLYKPYVPNRAEKFIHKNHSILDDQLEYLMSMIDTSSRLN